MSFGCHSYVIQMSIVCQLHVTRTAFVCARVLSVYIRMSYSYVIRMSLVCTRMLSMCH